MFDDVLGQHPNQLDRTRDDVDVSAADLLAVETAIGDVTEAGLRANVRVSIGYLDAWLGGNGAVAIDHLMEDAATVEIARSQVWQWLHYGTPLSNGRRITRELVDSIVDQELARWRRERRVDEPPRPGVRRLHRSSTRSGLPDLQHYRCLRALSGHRY